MPQDLDPKDSLIFLTNRIGRQLSGLVLGRMDMGDFKPQGTHMAIFADLYHHGKGVHQKDLAVSAIKDKATIARGLAQMEQEGIVVRITDPHDRRNKLISLTEKGRSINQVFQPALQDTMKTALAGIEEEALENCKRTLLRIFKNLHQHTNQPQDEEKK